jgi:hypothetical protein
VWWQFYFKPGTNVKKAAASISSIANKNALRPHNLLWQDKAQFEHEVGLLQRFLVDAPVSGGVVAASWAGIMLCCNVQHLE